MADAALGCSVGTGWAVTVALVAGAEPAVVDRRRVELVGNDERFAYHMAAERPLADARALVDRVAGLAARAAGAAVAEVVEAVAAAGHRLAGATVAGPEREADPPPLERVLAAHSRMHAAEGRLYRSALRAACADTGMTVVDVPRKGLAERVGAAGGGPPDAAAAVAGLGRALGPPWRREHKEAALAAWLILLEHRPPAG